VSCGLCALRPKNKYFKEINFASWFTCSCVKSGALTAGPMCGTSQVKEASRAQIHEHPTRGRVPVVKKLLLLILGAEPGCSGWLGEVVQQPEPERCLQ